MNKIIIQRIENKIKKLLGASRFPDYELKIDSSLNDRVAFNQKVGSKYIITISVDKNQKPNLSGFKHELIHLALKNFSFNSLKKDLPASLKYKDDDKLTKFMEYLVCALEIKIGNPADEQKNLKNYEKYGFSDIRYFYNLLLSPKINQSVIKNLIIKTNNFKAK